MQFTDIPAWDVAALATYLLLHVYGGIDHAWEIVAVLGFACSLDRDMHIHELIAAAYMVRNSCHTVQFSGSVGYIMCVLVVSASMCAQTARYQQQGHMVRRAAVGTATFLSVLVQYDWNINSPFSVVRLFAFVATTRLAVSEYDMDSWDAAVQAIWLLIVPAYAYVLVAFQFIAKVWRTWPLVWKRHKASDACLV